jgi:hypothetical protein
VLQAVLQTVLQQSKAKQRKICEAALAESHAFNAEIAAARLS